MMVEIWRHPTLHSAPGMGGEGLVFDNKTFLSDKINSTQLKSLHKFCLVYEPGKLKFTPTQGLTRRCLADDAECRIYAHAHAWQ